MKTKISLEVLLNDGKINARLLEIILDNVNVDVNLMNNDGVKYIEVFLNQSRIGSIFLDDYIKYKLI